MKDGGTVMPNEKLTKTSNKTSTDPLLSRRELMLSGAALATATAAISTARTSAAAATGKPAGSMAQPPFETIRDYVAAMEERGLLARFDGVDQDAYDGTAIMYKLIDEFVRHFGDWVLVGTQKYPSWPGPGFNALTNEYVRQGVEGGLLTLGLFATVIIVAFATAGRLRRQVERSRRQLAGTSDGRVLVVQRNAHRVRGEVIMTWALGISLFVHCVAFVGVSYYGQVLLVWYLALAFIASLAPAGRQRDARTSLRLVPVQA